MVISYNSFVQYGSLIIPIDLKLSVMIIKETAQYYVSNP